jgi:hypothetical protein
MPLSRAAALPNFATNFSSYQEGRTTTELRRARMPVQCSGGKKRPLPIAHWTKIREFTSKIISYQSNITLTSLVSIELSLWGSRAFLLPRRMDDNRTEKSKNASLVQ